MVMMTRRRFYHYRRPWVCRQLLFLVAATGVLFQSDDRFPRVVVARQVCIADIDWNNRTASLFMRGMLEEYGSQNTWTVVAPGAGVPSECKEHAMWIRRVRQHSITTVCLVALALAFLVSLECCACVCVCVTGVDAVFQESCALAYH